MHRIINNTPPGLRTDHRNGKKLDNRRSNLRTASATNNNRNARKRKGSRSLYKGVGWHKPTDKWLSRFKGTATNITMYFDTEMEAAYAYNLLAKRFADGFHRLNDLTFVHFSRDDRDRINNRVNAYLLKGLPSSNSSGYLGVSWVKQRRKWRVSYRGKYVGLFERLEDAATAYQAVTSKVKASRDTIS